MRCATHIQSGPSRLGYIFPETSPGTYPEVCFHENPKLRQLKMKISITVSTCILSLATKLSSPVD